MTMPTANAPNSDESRTVSSSGPPEALRPREVAARVRREHAIIRALLDDVQRACDAATERRSGAVDQLYRAVWGLHVTFEEHLAMEETLVAPIIRARETFGDARADDMLCEHDQQRRVLLELVDETERDTKDVDALIAQTRGLVEAFRKDMIAEDGWLEVLDQV